MLSAPSEVLIGHGDSAVKQASDRWIELRLAGMGADRNSDAGREAVVALELQELRGCPAGTGYLEDDCRPAIGSRSCIVENFVGRGARDRGFVQRINGVVGGVPLNIVVLSAPGRREGLAIFHHHLSEGLLHRSRTTKRDEDRRAEVGEEVAAGEAAEDEGSATRSPVSAKPTSNKSSASAVTTGSLTMSFEMVTSLLQKVGVVIVVMMPIPDVLLDGVRSCGTLIVFQTGERPCGGDLVDRIGQCVTRSGEARRRSLGRPKNWPG